jgi:hypothetical protein
VITSIESLFYYRKRAFTSTEENNERPVMVVAYRITM